MARVPRGHETAITVREEYCSEREREREWENGVVGIECITIILLSYGSRVRPYTRRYVCNAFVSRSKNPKFLEFPSSYLYRMSSPTRLTAATIPWRENSLHARGPSAVKFKYTTILETPIVIIRIRDYYFVQKRGRFDRANARRASNTKPSPFWTLSTTHFALFFWFSTQKSRSRNNGIGRGRSEMVNVCSGVPVCPGNRETRFG